MGRRVYHRPSPAVLLTLSTPQGGGGFRPLPLPAGTGRFCFTVKPQSLGLSSTHPRQILLAKSIRPRETRGRR